MEQFSKINYHVPVFYMKKSYQTNTVTAEENKKQYRNLYKKPGTCLVKNASICLMISGRGVVPVNAKDKKSNASYMK
jgi:hypothetical protein